MHKLGVITCNDSARFVIYDWYTSLITVLGSERIINQYITGKRIEVFPHAYKQVVSMVTHPIACHGLLYVSNPWKVYPRSMNLVFVWDHEMFSVYG